jgi:hypothetical protein
MNYWMQEDEMTTLIELVQTSGQRYQILMLQIGE